MSSQEKKESESPQSKIDSLLKYIKEKSPTYEWQEFLISVPPGTHGFADNVILRKPLIANVEIRTPDLLLHCSSKTCNGERMFSCIDKPIFLEADKFCPIYLTYSCRNCQTSSVYFAIGFQAFSRSNNNIASVIKIGQWPPFGPPTPAKLISLIGPDRDLYLRGRRAENQGLGIGAYAYYRRVVENQKNRILEEIKRVAQKQTSSSKILAALDAAIIETQFSKAAELLKDAIPEALLIEGNNPLTLLYKALSQQLHDGSDEESLELAQSIRVVLTELAERSGQILKDDAELKDAIARLQKRISLPDQK